MSHPVFLDLLIFSRDAHTPLRCQLLSVPLRRQLVAVAAPATPVRASRIAGPTPSTPPAPSVPALLERLTTAVERSNATLARVTTLQERAVELIRISFLSYMCFVLV